MKTQNIDISKETIAYFCQHWHITKISLFGSVLRDDFRSDSDIDVLVEFQPEHTAVCSFIRDSSSSGQTSSANA